MVALLAAAGGAQGNNVGVTLKLMEFDLTQPQREQYTDKNLGDGLIDFAISNAWEQQRQTAIDAIRSALSGPDKLGAGMTAREISVTLGEPQSPRLTVQDRVRGRLELMVPGNAVSLTTTHPISRGPSMDPRLRIGFALNLVIEFQVVSKAPFVRAQTAFVQPSGVVVQGLNLSADLGLSVDDILSALGGVRTIGEKIAGGMERSKLDITGRFNSYLAGNAGLLALPPGYVFNGGRVEPTRVLIAAYRPSQPVPVDAMIAATWPKSIGELMADCRPVEIGAQYQSGPHSLHGDAPPMAAAQVVAMNPRYSSNDAFNCYAVVSVPSGVPLNVSWARPVHVPAGGPNNKYLQATVDATPQGWSNPVVANAGSSRYKLTLSRHIGGTGAGVQLNAAQAARANPGDPVASRLKDAARINPAEAALPAKAVQARAAAANKAMLNPQPLPPTDPKAQTNVRTDALREAVDRNAVGSALSQQKTITLPQSELELAQPR